MVPARFTKPFAAIRRLRGGNANGGRPDLSRHASRVVHEMAVATFVLDRDGRVAMWNDACARLTGLEAAKVIGTKDHWKGFYLAARPCLADLALEGGAAKVSSLYAAQGDGGRSDRLEAKNWCDLPRGARVYLAIDADLVRDSTGALVGVVETLQDLTAVKEAEAAIAAERARAAERLETVVAALGAGLAELATGDLVARVETELHEEADRLRLDFNAAAEALHSAMGAIVEVVATIRGGADQISGAIDELSTRTEGQATNLEQTAAAVDQITGTVKKTAQVVGAAHKVVSAAKGDAERSGEIVRQAIAAMGGIEQSSKHIVRIIGVARWRRGARLCGRRLGSARAGATLGRSGQGDQRPHFVFGDPGRSRRRPRRADWQGAGTDRRSGRRDRQRRLRHRRQRRGAGERAATGRSRRIADGSDDPAQR